MAGIGHFQSTRPFTEDLTICESTGVGFQTNQEYFRDGNRRNEHELEDKSFHYRPDPSIALYGVFDGNYGEAAADYVVEEMPGQILLGQLSENITEEEICRVLKEAFITVERGYFQTIVDPLLVERMKIFSEISDRDESTDYYCGNDQKRLELLNRGIQSSTTALVVLIFNSQLYIANAGNCRAHICVTDPKRGTPEIKELNHSHDLHNTDELQRLQFCSIDINRLKRKFGNDYITRCIGNYLLKGGYHEDEILCSGKSEPIIAEPEVTSCPITDSINYLAILSSGLYKAVEEIDENVNAFLANLIFEELNAQSTINGVAQAVVDRVARNHQEVDRVSKREDMTLLIRTFNVTLRSISRSSPSTRYPSFTSATSSNTLDVNTLNLNSLDEIFTVDPDATSFGTETDSSDSISQNNPKSPQKVKSYVDFSNYYNAISSDPNFSENLFSSISTE